MPVQDQSEGAPRGRRLIICTGPCCNRTGEAKQFYDGLLAELAARRLNDDSLGGDLLGETKCIRRACLGKCTGEPLAYVDPDGIWYHNLSTDNLLRIVKDHVLNERPVVDLIMEEED
jgi:(2Fe-2S) ferredoxin